MIYLDVTKSAAARHRSGLTRVNARLLAEWGSAAAPVAWGRRGWSPGPADTWLTAELFSEAERPGISDFLRKAPGRRVAIFHDAIPLRFPHITWPRSVARHPGYLKLLAGFDRIWAVSAASRDDLLGFWRWQGVTTPPPVDLLALGADFDGAQRTSSAEARVPRAKADPASSRPNRPDPPCLLCVGILEPRKNQSFLLEVCADLWTEGLKFDLHIVGRVNPHFGRPIARRIETLRRKWPGLRHHPAADDRQLARLYAGARASVFPTIAEGCGLPLLESLWRGVPCVCSDLPVLRENADGGGCRTVPVNDRAAWASALRETLTDDGEHERRRTEAMTRPLPTWADTARVLREALKRL